MIKTDIITDCDMSAVTEFVSEIYNKHKVLEVKFSTDTTEFHMYYTVLIIYEIGEVNVVKEVKENDNSKTDR